MQAALDQQLGGSTIEVVHILDDAGFDRPRSAQLLTEVTHGIELLQLLTLLPPECVQRPQLGHGEALGRVFQVGDGLPAVHHHWTLRVRPDLDRLARLRQSGKWHVPLATSTRERP